MSLTELNRASYLPSAIVCYSEALVAGENVCSTALILGLRSRLCAIYFINVSFCSLYIFTIYHSYLLIHYLLFIIIMCLPVAVYDGCGIVAFVYWLRLNQYL